MIYNCAFVCCNNNKVLFVYVAIEMLIPIVSRTLESENGGGINH